MKAALCSLGREALAAKPRRAYRLLTLNLRLRSNRGKGYQSRAHTLDGALSIRVPARVAFAGASIRLAPESFRLFPSRNQPLQSLVMPLAQSAARAAATHFSNPVLPRVVCPPQTHLQ